MTTRRPSPKILLSVLLTLPCALAQSALAQEPAPASDVSPAPKTKFRTRRFIEPNKLAPELYADRLSVKLTLVDLPGAGDPRSTWDGTYQLYFISEAEMRRVEEEVLRKKGAASSGGVRMVGWDPTPADFPEKILVAEGTISKKNLATPQQRVHLQENVAFKEKIPAALRTKGARLLTAYSIKVYDAKLKTPVYESGVFITFPFDDQTDPDRVAPRTTVYTNFLVTPKGEVWNSQLPRKDGDTKWDW
jgi:hypothetical protein